MSLTVVPHTGHFASLCVPQFTLASDDEASLPAVAAMLEKERARGGGAQNATSAVVLNASGLSAVQAFSFHAVHSALHVPRSPINSMITPLCVQAFFLPREADGVFLSCHKDGWSSFSSVAPIEYRPVL